MNSVGIPGAFRGNAGFRENLGSQKAQIGTLAQKDGTNLNVAQELFSQ